LIWSACGDSTLFVIGSSGVEYALAAHWHGSGVIAATTSYSLAGWIRGGGEVDKLIVVSGSCSTVTKGQIEWASRNGFAAIELNAIELTDGSEAERERDRIRRKALDALSQGRSVMLYSAKGPEHIAATMAEFRARGMGESTARERLGEQQGILLRELLAATKLRRACVAGGDTSSYAIRQLGIYALELCAPLAPGSPLCRAYSHDAALDGVEIAMKGGQRGEPDYFGSVRRGTIQ
jgi:3-oxoisoapionate kinase